MIQGIDHPAIAAENPDALAQWYIDTLGFHKHTRLPDKPVWLIGAPDGIYIEIMPKDGTERPERTTWTPGFSHLALRVADFAAAETALTEAGVTWSGDEAVAVGGGRLRSFLDPEGNMLQIVER